jgi:hypothetical protein
VSFCPADCRPCADAACSAVCEITGTRRLDVCEACGELLEFEMRVHICRHCMIEPDADSARSAIDPTPR